MVIPNRPTWLRLIPGLHLFALPVLFLVISCGGQQQTPPPPVILSFVAEPSRISQGASATLRWSVANASSVEISGIGAVTGSSRAVSPTSDTKYTLTAREGSQTATQDLTVSVIPSAPAPTITSFTASPNPVTPGQSTTLAWTVSSDATRVTLDGVDVTGTTSKVETLTATKTYSLVASNGTQSSSPSTLTVNVVAPSTTPVIDSFVAQPDTIVEGQSSTLNWSVTHATSVEIDGVVQTTNSLSVSPTASKTYTLRARNGTQSASSEVLLTVVPKPSATEPPAVLAFQVTPNVIQPGSSATLSWSVTGDATVTIDCGLGTVTGNSVTVSPKMSQVYTLTATNSLGEVRLSTPLSVVPAAGELYVSPSGNDANPGSLAAPLATLAKAVTQATPGQTIMVRGGTYQPTAQLDINKAGTADRPYRIMAYPGEVPVFDGTRMTTPSTPQHYTYFLRFQERAAFWHVYGITFTKAPSSAIRIQGGQDIVLEAGVSSYSGMNSNVGAGINLSDGSRVVALNWDSHHNANRLGGADVYGNSDGFGWGPTGQGCKLYGCRMWNDSDDGVDVYFANFPTIMERCWIYGSGIDDAQGSISGTPNKNLADGSGFKLGPCSPNYPAHLIQYCLAWGNKAPGFEDNQHAGTMKLYHNTSYNNGVLQTGAVEFEFAQGSHDLRNNLAFNTLGRRVDNVKAGPARNNSWDLAGVTVGAEDFVSLDDTGMLGPRKPDGSLPDLPFLRLKPTSDLANKGLPGLPYKGSAPDLGAFEATQ